VKFVLRHDRAGDLFRFAPLDSAAFRLAVPEAQQATLPDSVVVLTSDGQLLVRSNAFLHIIRRFGRGWRMFAAVIAIVPRPLRDAVYNLVARTRYHIFGRKDDVCPLMPPELRNRFDLD